MGCALLLAAAACGEGAGAPPAGAGEVTTLPVRWGRDIVLEETEEVVNVAPNVRLDAAGRILVADTRESQLRIYRPDGRLARHFGRRGKGPGEFVFPVAAAPLPSGRLLAVEMSGRFTLYDGTGERVEATGRFPVHSVFDVDVLDEHRVVLSGPGGGPGSPLLHVADLRTGRVLRSFFTPRVPAKLSDEYFMTLTLSTEVRADTIATVYARSDTLYLFSPDGAVHDRVPVPYRGYRALTESFEGRGREDIIEWSKGFSMTSKLAWRPDGGFLVQYYDRVGEDIVYTLLGMTRRGEKLFEAPGSPRLMAWSSSGELFFVKPGSEVPNVWTTASLAR